MFMPLRCDQTPPWPLLQAHYADRGRHLDMRRAFEQDADRFAHFSQSAPHVFADLSKNLWDRESEALLLDLARATGLEAHRNAMFAGEAINTTSSAPRCKRSAYGMMLAITVLAECITPLGSPVVPDVKPSKATSSRPVLTASNFTGLFRGCYRLTDRFANNQRFVSDRDLNCLR